MATQPIVSSNIDSSVPINGNALALDQQLDKYARTEAERTVILSPDHAEAVNVEVVNGKHDTYDDALAHIIDRGLAEIKRTRAAQEATRSAKALATEAQSYNNLLTQNPSLITNAEFVANMMKKLGELSVKAKPRKA